MSITEDEIIAINKKAMEKADTNELSSAENLLLQLLINFPETCNPSAVEVITLNNCAYICEKRGNYLKAISLLLRAFQFKPSNPKEYTQSLGTIINLSCINSYTGNLKIALKQAFKAVEMVELESLVVHKPAAYYNLSCILAKMQKFEKAGFYFSESIDICKNLLGNNHLLTIASIKHAQTCNLKYTNRDKHPSFTSHTAKLTKYTVKFPEFEQNSLEKKTKFNSSTRVSSIISNKKTIFTKRAAGVGVPYLKEIRYSIRNKFSNYVPRSYNSEPIEKIKDTRHNSSIYFKKDTFKDRFRNIKQKIMKLEIDLEEFLIISKDTYKVAGFMEEVDENILKSIVKIQLWLKSRLIKKF